MSTPSLVEISPRIKSYGRFIFKKFEFFEICSGFVKNFLRYRFPKKIWPGNVLGETLFVFFSVRLRNEIVLTLTFKGVGNYAPREGGTKKFSRLFGGNFLTFLEIKNAPETR